MLCGTPDPATVAMFPFGILPDTVVPGVVYVDVPRGVDSDVDRIVQRGDQATLGVSAKTGLAVSGECRNCLILRIHDADPVVSRVSDVQIAGRVERDALRTV